MGEEWVLGGVSYGSTLSLHVWGRTEEVPGIMLCPSFGRPGSSILSIRCPLIEDMSQVHAWCSELLKTKWISNSVYYYINYTLLYSAAR
jgi:hypothetical protein